MEDLKKNQKFIFLIAGCLAFLFMAFLPAVDIMGKESANGFKFVFEATGGGFSRFTMLLAILGPLAGAVYSQVVPEVKWGKNMLYIFGGSAIIGLLTLVILPTGCSFATGSWLSLILCVAAGIFAFMLTQPEKK